MNPGGMEMENKNERASFGRERCDEAAFRYMYEHGIAAEDCREHEEELRPFFPSAELYEAFEAECLSRIVLLSWKKFLEPGQRLDFFPHPRYIQQDPHLHDFFEMKYQLAGSGTVYAGGETFYLRQSDVFLIPPYVPHRNEVYTDDARMINIVLPPEHLPELFPRLMSFPSPLSRFFSENRSETLPMPGRRFLQIRTGENAEIRGIVLNSLEYCLNRKGRTLRKEMQTEAAVERMLLLLLDYVAGPGSESISDSRDRKAVSEMTGYMRFHLADVKLEDIARLFHYSPSYTSRFIRSRTGYSFQTLLLILRMEEASRLLRETGLTVEQIGLQVGMTGKTHFYTKFREMFGVNPGQYRTR